jgi:hypothetical protein
MTKRCLLLRLPDSREVFTHEKHQNSLSEFAKTFNVKIIPVEAESPVLLHPKQIAQVFCDQSQQTFSNCSYRLLNPQSTKTLTGYAPNARNQMLQKVSDVRSYIEAQFLEGQVVDIKKLHHRFSKHNIAVSTLYRHLAYVKAKLNAEGHRVMKVKTGCYRLA